MTNSIRVHPMALLHPERLDAETRLEVEKVTAGYGADKAAYFVDRLAEGVGTIAAAFYPKPVVVRLSDFKSNEYASLVGGRAFEPHEENPMLGLRGASRYTHPSYTEAFALECRALLNVRREMGLDNVRIMVPFCRRVEEGARVLDEMARYGLRRGQDGLEIYVMCEIPNNVIQIDAFCRLFDGISIGSNDLTQLTLGVDRDSPLVAFDERDPGVLEMMRLAVDGAHRNGRHVGICGQAPSDYPEIAAFLVGIGIDALSINPDSVLATTVRLLEIERGDGCTRERVRAPTSKTTTNRDSPAFENIVVATDLETESAAARAVDLAVELATALRATLTLVHVHELPADHPYAAASFAAWHRNAVEAATRAFATFADSVRERSPDAKAVLRQGRPWAEILAAAADVGADLIVMGSARRWPSSEVSTGCATTFA